jgi:hypothetical protein
MLYGVTHAAGLRIHAHPTSTTMKAPQSNTTRRILADEEKARKLMESLRTGRPEAIEVNGKFVYAVRRRPSGSTQRDNRSGDAERR